jgi:hypothetical protein
MEATTPYQGIVARTANHPKPRWDTIHQPNKGLGQSPGGPRAADGTATLGR